MALSNIQQQALRTEANGYYINDDLIFSFEDTNTTVTEKEVKVTLLSVGQRRTGGIDYKAEASTVIKLYKNTEGKFTYNYKDVVKKLVQTIGYDDGTTDSNIFNNLFLQLTDNTDNAQITEDISLLIIADLQVNENPITDMHLLHEEYKTVVFNTNNRILGTKFQLWRGYPFDITIYELYNSQEITIEDGTGGDNILKLSTTRLHYTTKIPYVNISNDDDSDSSTLSLILLKGSGTSISLLENKRYQNFIDINSECSADEKKKHLYIKWLNKYGAFDYWLFKKTAIDDTKSKHRGIASKNNVMQTVGIDTVTSQEVYYSYLSEVHLEKLKYLGRSIKVYAYLENNTFAEVIISNFTVDKNNEVRFTVTYPYNNTLI